MSFFLDAACCCNTGKVRKNNEDNFFFYGQCLEAENNGLEQSISMSTSIRGRTCFAVFDGMGGENFGEQASYAAANFLKHRHRTLGDIFKSDNRFLKDLCFEINDAVLKKAEEYSTSYMGSTMVLLCFVDKHVSVCNLGDSRAYRLRNGEFLQISKDHVDDRPRIGKRKAPLSQHLGIDKDTFLIEPYIEEHELQYGDQYFICSDGVTDMLADSEIQAILSAHDNTEECIKSILAASLDKGGKDNITAILCRVKRNR